MTSKPKNLFTSERGLVSEPTWTSSPGVYCQEMNVLPTNWDVCLPFNLLLFTPLKVLVLALLMLTRETVGQLVTYNCSNSTRTPLNFWLSRHLKSMYDAVKRLKGNLWWITDGAEMRNMLIMEALTGRTGNLQGATAQHAPI